MQNIGIIVGGAAGEGSKKAGHLIAKLFNAHKLRIFIHEDYGSVIKGGHNFSHICISKEEKNATSKKIDFLLALNAQTVEKHKDKIKKSGLLICDEGIGEVDYPEDKTVKIPLSSIVSEAGGIPLMKNTALVCGFAKIMGVKWEKLEEVLRRELKKDTEKNIEVAKLAYEKTETQKSFKEGEGEVLPLVSGNQAAAIGALYAGLENYFAYPMTPSTGVLVYLSAIEGVRTFQPESEIAVVTAGLASAYAGKRTMIGTSGGGFALMTEGVSFSAISETPITIIMSQRLGPASGVPTYQSQGDLLFVLNSGQGDMMRFVVTPGDADETCYLTGKAVNIAWKYQMPSIVLLDKELSENTYNLKGEYKIEKEEALLAEDSVDYNRYDGEDVSPLLFPGGEGIVKTTSYEHDKKGISTEEAEEISAMSEKRMRKYEKLKEELKEMEVVKTYKKGKTAVIFWGSVKGPVMEATKNLDVKLVQIMVAQPLLEEEVKKALEGVKKVICVEENATGQMAQVLNAHGIKVDEKILKYDGRPFTIEEIKKRIKDKL